MHDSILGRTFLVGLLAAASAGVQAELCEVEAVVPVLGTPSKGGSIVLAFDIENTGNSDLTLVSLDVALIEIRDLQVYSRPNTFNASDCVIDGSDPIYALSDSLCWTEATDGLTAVTADHEGFAHVSLPSPVRVAKHSQVGIYLTSTGSLKRSLFSRRAGGQVNTDSGPLKVFSGAGLSHHWARETAAVGKAHERTFVGRIHYELDCAAARGLPQGAGGEGAGKGSEGGRSGEGGGGSAGSAPRARLPQLPPRAPPAPPVTVAALALADAQLIATNAWSRMASNVSFVAVHGANVRAEGLGSQIVARLSCMLQAQAGGDGSLRYAHAPFSEFSKLSEYPELSGAEAFVNMGAGEVQFQALAAAGIPENRILDGIPPFHDPARVPFSPPTCFGFLAAHTALAQLLRPQLRARLFQGKPQRRRAYFADPVIRVVVHVKRPDEPPKGGGGRAWRGRELLAGGAGAREEGDPESGRRGRDLRGRAPAPPSASALSAPLRAVLSAARSNLRDCRVIIHSEGAMGPYLEALRSAAPGAEIIVGGNALEAWLDLVNADILLADASLFSFSAGLYSEGVVVYRPFAFSGRGMRDWFSAEEAGDGGPGTGLAEQVEAAVAQRLVLDAARDAFSAPPAKKGAGGQAAVERGGAEEEDKRDEEGTRRRQ